MWRMRPGRSARRQEARLERLRGRIQALEAAQRPAGGRLERLKAKVQALEAAQTPNEAVEEEPEELVPPVEGLVWDQLESESESSSESDGEEEEEDPEIEQVEEPEMSEEEKLKFKKWLWLKMARMGWNRRARRRMFQSILKGEPVCQPLPQRPRERVRYVRHRMPPPPPPPPPPPMYPWYPPYQAYPYPPQWGWAQPPPYYTSWSLGRNGTFAQKR